MKTLEDYPEFERMQKAQEEFERVVLESPEGASIFERYTNGDAEAADDFLSLMGSSAPEIQAVIQEMECATREVYEKPELVALIGARIRDNASKEGKEAMSTLGSALMEADPDHEATMAMSEMNSIIAGKDLQ